ncbi:Flp pilus assembly protein CpaB [Novosphingobium album (ex Liu et al. 2023)]|uniref:Flp pilus assembly protein CpaB n=1 Tax=Novosphingobium album (ex Liu et al. 2023) TaxID=3031130 RepID=UPI00319E99A0
MTIGIGVVAAASFAYLGVRELGQPPRPKTDPAQAQRAVAQAPAIVLAATTRPIRTGETITADMVRSAPADPRRFPMAATPAEVIGKVATRDIPANTLITRTAIDQDSTLAIRVPLGMRAISIDTTAEIAVAGLVRPGDRVDVQVVYPGADALSGARGDGHSRAQTLLQMVQVLAVGDTVVGTPPPQSGIVPGAEGAAGGETTTQTSAAPPQQVARTVTLALFPEQVSALSLAKSTGALYLSLRNPRDDANLKVAQVVSSGPLPQRAAPIAAAPAMVPQQVRVAPASPAPARTRPSPHAIELVVGGNREVIYSGSAR